MVYEDTLPRIINILEEHLGVDEQNIYLNSNFVDDLGSGFVFSAFIRLAQNRLVSRERGLGVVLHTHETLATVRISLVKKRLNLVNTHRARSEKFVISDDVSWVKGRAQGQHKPGPRFPITAAGPLEIRGGQERTSTPNEGTHSALGE